MGTPKSGTTSLQNLLAANRPVLRKHGYLYPGKRPGHFLEVLDLREAGFRGHRFEGSEGAWDRVVKEVLAHRGPALLSHEILGASTRPVIDKAVGSFGDRPVRVLVTCRDLGRQVPAVWQEGVKNGDKETYREFLDKVLGAWDGPDTRANMWRAQNLASLGARWAERVGTENVVFVTVPPSGASKDLLWQRFATAAGLPEADYQVADQPRNPSMGTVETELLRRLLAHLPEDVPFPVYSRQVKRRLAERTLVLTKAGGTLTVPEDRRPAVAEMAAAINASLVEQGFPVVGDIADLEPAYSSSGTSPDDVPDAVLLERALEVMGPMVLRDGPHGEGRAPGKGGKAARVGGRLRGRRGGDDASADHP
ncbi:hypothetical protein [Nocardioides taihuensis]|uniref:Sulfotransferase family protein n=1 Tax=Nocardioides taihuensis TaxID=1835606 RepID=A0ABW0BMH9_9ACTN